MLARVMTAKKAVPLPSVSEVPLDGAFDDDDDPFALPANAAAVPQPLPPADSQPIDLFRAPPQPEPSAPLDLGLDAVAEQASHEPRRPRPASQPKIINSSQSPVASNAEPTAPQSAADTQAHDTGLVVVIELKRERDGLKREVEELRQKVANKPNGAGSAPGGGFSREREFLNLRETINKKEREVLDLKDAADVKERAILDHATKLRESERRLHDLEEHSLATEKDSGRCPREDRSARPRQGARGRAREAGQGAPRRRAQEHHPLRRRDRGLEEEARHRRGRGQGRLRRGGGGARGRAARAPRSPSVDRRGDAGRARRAAAEVAGCA